MEKLLTPETKIFLLEISEENAKIFDGIFTRAVSLRKTIDKNGDKYDATVLNVLEFVGLLGCDLNWLFIEMVKHHSLLRGKLYARLLVLTIFESCKSLKKLLAREFREEFTARLALKDDERLKRLHSTFCQLFEQCNRNFAAVRNGIVGHWDCDPQMRIELLKQANAPAVADLVRAMLIPLGELGDILFPYIDYVMNEIESSASLPK